MTVIKLLAYRDLIKKAFRHLELRKMLESVNAQRDEIVRSTETQMALAEAEKTQNDTQGVIHLQNVKQQCADTAKTRETTHNVMKEHFQHLVDETVQGTYSIPGI